MLAHLDPQAKADCEPLHQSLEPRASLTRTTRSPFSNRIEPA